MLPWTRPTWSLRKNATSWSWRGCPWAAPSRCGSRRPAPWRGWWWSTPAWFGRGPAETYVDRQFERVGVYRSTVDHVVSESSMEALRRGLTNAPLEVVRLENSYHVATMDNDAPEIFRGTAEFVRSVAAAAGPGAARASRKDTAND